MLRNRHRLAGSLIVLGSSIASAAIGILFGAVRMDGPVAVPRLSPAADASVRLMVSESMKSSLPSRDLVDQLELSTLTSFVDLSVFSINHRVLTASDQSIASPVLVTERLYWQLLPQVGENGGGGLLLSSRAAEQLFGTPNRAIGSLVTVDETQHEVLHVEDAGFTVWFQPESSYDAILLAPPSGEQVEVSGRLRPGVTSFIAAEELSARMPDGLRAKFLSFKDLVETDFLRLFQFSILLGSLLSGCILVTVGFLNYERANTKAGDVEIRWLVGASEFQLLRREVLAGLAEALLASALAVGFMFAGRWLLVQLAPRDLLWLTAAHSVERGMFFASALLLVLPFLRVAVNRPILSHLGSGLIGHGPTRSQKGMTGRNHILVGTAVAVVLTATSLLLLEAVAMERARSSQSVLEEVDAMTLDLSAVLDQSRRNQLLSDLGSRLASSPETFTFGFSLGSGFTIPGVILGEIDLGTGSKPQELLPFQLVKPGYFECYGLAQLAGRGFSAHEPSGSGIVVSRSFAQKFGSLPQHAVGRPIRVNGQEKEIIGVVDNLQIPGIAEVRYRDLIYLPMRATPERLVLSARTATGNQVPWREIFSGVEDDLRWSPDRGELAFATRHRQRTVLATVFLVVSTLSIILLTGMLVTTTRIFLQQRRLEVAIRSALGAHSTPLLRWVCERSLSPQIKGAIVGSFIALCTLLFMSGRIPSRPSIWVPLLMAAAIVVAVSALTAWVTARSVLAGSLSKPVAEVLVRSR